MKKRRVLFIILMMTSYLLTGCGAANAEKEAAIQESKIVTENRELTSGEAFALQVSKPALYLYEGKGPEQVYYSIKEGQYPKEELTEDQILWLIEQKYKDIPEERYSPKENQIAYEDAKKYVPTILKDYVTDDEMETCYLYYGSTPFDGEMSDSWLALVHMKDGDRDYSIYFDAEDGQLIRWNSQAKDYYTEEGFTVVNRSGENENTSRTDEELCTACESFLKDTAFGNAERKFEDVKVLGNEDMQQTAQLELSLKDGSTIVLYVDKNDLSIECLEIR